MMSTFGVVLGELVGIAAYRKSNKGEGERERGGRGERERERGGGGGRRGNMI